MIIAVIVRLIHQHTALFAHEPGVHLDKIFYTMMMIAVIVYAGNIVVYLLKRHRMFLWVNAMHLALTSITIIVAGNGMLEYHFSIFMVMAVATFYQRKSLLLFMTAIFALHHFGSYLFMPEFAFGQSSYPFSMVMTHAVFLILTAAASMMQIYRKQKDWNELQSKYEKQKEALHTIIGSLTQTSEKIKDDAGGLFRTGGTQLSAIRCYSPKKRIDFYPDRPTCSKL